MIKVAVNDFVRRQVKGSGKTYSNSLSFEHIADHARLQFEAGHYRNGYRDGVIIVDVAPLLVSEFSCPFVKLNASTRLKAEWVKRREGEEPYIKVWATTGEELPAQRVELILYSHDVLAENDEQTTDAEWELISIHALPKGEERLPMGPVTMMRNQLELPGGMV